MEVRTPAHVFEAEGEPGTEIPDALRKQNSIRLI